MTGLTALYVMGGAVMVAALFLWAVIRGAKAQGKAEAEAEAEKRQTEAITQTERLKDEALARMAEAAAASVSEPAVDARERMRNRPRSTK